MKREKFSPTVTVNFLLSALNVSSTVSFEQQRNKLNLKKIGIFQSANNQLHLYLLYDH